MPVPFKIRSRKARPDDHEEIARFIEPDEPLHVAWIEGTAVEEYEIALGRSDDEAIGRLIVILSNSELPLVVADVILEYNL
jgi:hypothetical protein